MAADGFDGRLAFAGGEPTLRPELPGWIADARRLGARWIVLQTNARRLSEPGYAKTLARAGLDAVEASLQGSTSPMHDYHTGVPGGFEATLSGAAQAKRARLTLAVATVVTRSNFRHLDDIVRLAHGVRASAIRIEAAERLGRARESWERIVPAPELIAAPMAQALRLARGLGLQTLSGGTADGPLAERLFAGLGLFESSEGPSPKETPAPAPPRRPAPGAGEVRTKAKKTGEALRDIFPTLFEPGSGGA